MSRRRSDLQIKDEQFEFLYSSLRARTQQNSHSRELDNSLLKSRVDFLESAIFGQDEERRRLQARLNAAELRLSQLGCRQGQALSRYSLSRIPDDVIGLILEFMGSRELGMISCADKHLNHIASTDRMWKTKYLHYWGASKLNQVLAEDIRALPADKSVKAEAKKTWKERFGEQQTLENNWRRQICNVTNLEAHSGTVTCIQLRGNRMYSGSDDGSLICWAIEDRNSLVVEEDSLKLAPPPALPLAQLVDAMSSASISGLRDQSFHHQLYQRKGTKKKTCSKMRTFHGHGGPVWCLGQMLFTIHSK